MKRFLNYVEIQTKITSLFAFSLTLGYLIFQNISIKFMPTLIFFVGMFTFDLTTTAINNYIDSKDGKQDIGYTRTQGKFIIYGLLAFAIVMGLVLVALTDIVILLLGMMCFGIGILYTWGPVPISRQPYGEIISGVLYGYVIPFILIHANAPGYLVIFGIDGGYVNIGIHFMEMIYYLIVFLPPTVLTASIMLANNTCDVDDDVLVKRYTLPYYIGKKNAVTLMAVLYVSVYVAIGCGVVLGQLPWTALVTFATIPVVIKNFKSYTKDLVKRLSFKFIIKNFILIMAVYALSVLIGSIFL